MYIFKSGKTIKGEEEEEEEEEERSHQTWPIDRY